jgi:histidine triad (HIT) family protein
MGSGQTRRMPQMDETCAFCRIVAGGPAHRVFEDSHCIAFLDLRPVFPGHTLLIPREHVETLTDLPDGLVLPFSMALRHLAGAVERAMGAKGTFVGVNNRVSQSVPHLHAHVIPRTKGDGLRGFFWPRVRYESDDAMADVAARISAAAATA